MVKPLKTQTKGQKAEPSGGEPDEPKNDVVPQPVGPATNAPDWMLKAGTSIGAVVLVALLALIFYPGTQDIMCQSRFALVGLFFSLAVGLSSAALGGGAALKGTFGEAYIGRATHFAAYGGFATMLIAWLIFMALALQTRTSCVQKADLPEISFAEIPKGFVAVSGNNTWLKRTVQLDGEYSLQVNIENKIEDSESFKLLFRNQYDKSCVLRLYLTENIENKKKNLKGDFYESVHDTIQFEKSPANIIFKLKDIDISKEITSIKDNSTKEVKSSCFSYNGKIFDGVVIISKNENKISTGESYSTLGGDSDEPAANLPDADGQKTSFLSIISKSFAGEPNSPTYGDLKTLLDEGTPEQQVAARQFLTTSFKIYQDEILRDLFSNTTDPPMRAASLLSALISGIGENEAFLPGKARDLSMPLPAFMAGREADILDLSMSVNSTVAKQARRFLQRYPLDLFDRMMRERVSKITSEKCVVMVSEKDQNLLYASIFLNYNRIIEFGYNSTISDFNVQSIDEMSKLVLDSSNCLSKELRVDTALVFFGAATVFSGQSTPSRMDNAKQAAKEFLSFVDPLGAESYYFAKHVAIMRRLAV
jgi:hypothetical protein